MRLNFALVLHDVFVFRQFPGFYLWLFRFLFGVMVGLYPSCFVQYLDNSIRLIRTMRLLFIS